MLIIVDPFKKLSNGTATGWHWQLQIANVGHAECQDTTDTNQINSSWALSQGYIGGIKLPGEKRWKMVKDGERWNGTSWELLWMLIRGSIGPIPTFPLFQMEKKQFHWKTGWAQAVSLSAKLWIDPNSLCDAAIWVWFHPSLAVLPQPWSGDGPWRWKCRNSVGPICSVPNGQHQASSKSIFAPVTRITAQSQVWAQPEEMKPNENGVCVCVSSE